MRKFIVLLLFVALSLTLQAKSQSRVVSSPDGHLRLTVTIDNNISYSLARDNVRLLESCPLSVTLGDGRCFDGKSPAVKMLTRGIQEKIYPMIYKKDEILSSYNELLLSFKTFDLTFRVYDDGAAYRFTSKISTPHIIRDEQVELNFAGDWKAYIPYSTKQGDFNKQFDCSYQAVYNRDTLSRWKEGQIALLPLLVEAPQGIRICFTEADLLSYPSMFAYNPDGRKGFKGLFQHYPSQFKLSSSKLMNKISEYEDYIAKLDGRTELPWRVIVVAPDDAALLDNDLVYKLATPSDPAADYSWVRPGKVAWDWWNNWNIYGVDFRAGINNKTYEYYIDFASDNGIEYVILDEGWSVPGKGNLLEVIPEIDIKHLVDYGAQRGVGIILWAGYAAFERDMEKVCNLYSALGVKGFKIDFMNRADQQIVKFYTKAAQTAARYRLLVDFHGSFKPAGLCRTYPNAINFEGVYGLEENKWEARSDAMDQVEYDVTAPYIRYVAGPADYTQGAMRNATKKNYRALYSEPMSMGTRCHQIAEYVIFFAPVTMLCDSPSNYMREQECTSFISSVPVVWEQTIALGGKISEYASIARRSGDEWYVASLNNWEARELTLKLDFIREGNYTMEIFRDGINADRAARDYKREVIPLPSSREVVIKMAPGGGWAAKIYKEQKAAVWKTLN